MNIHVEKNNRRGTREKAIQIDGKNKIYLRDQRT